MHAIFRTMGQRESSIHLTCVASIFKSKESAKTTKLKLTQTTKHMINDVEKINERIPSWIKALAAAADL